MAKLGVITDGISTDFEHALKVMSENNLNQAELQYLWDKGIYDNTFTILQESGHNTYKTYNYLINQIKNHSTKKFEIFTNYSFESIDNLKIL